MKTYNWWTDPANAEVVKRISWWEHPENKTTIQLPVSIIEKDGAWSIATNINTRNLIGDLGNGTFSSKSKEDAIEKFWKIMKMSHDYETECRLKYQRWVPFRHGDWSIGGRWFVIFGINFYFRLGNNMKGGWYIPFTKLNIMVHSEWAVYKRWKKEHKNK